MRAWALLGLIALLACGGSSGPDVVSPSAGEPPAEAQPMGPVDAELVGTWEGTIEGGNESRTASGDITMNLNADGSLSVRVNNAAYHPINQGEWSVVDDRFTALGIDSVGGTVEFAAPRSTTRLDGTWRSGGGSGTYSVTRD